MTRMRLLLVGSSLLASCMPALPDVSPGGGQAAPGAEAPGGGVCGGGSWQPGWLEIHHIDAGQATSTLVVSPAGRSLLVDAGETTWDGTEGAETIGPYVRAVLGCARLDYVLATHFHLDHVGFPGYGGLWHLVERQGFAIGLLLHRDLFRYVGVGGATLAAWQAYLQSDASHVLHPQVAVVGGSQVDLGPGVAFAIVALDGAGVLPAADLSNSPAPPDENDYSIAALLRMGRLDYFMAGDLSGETLISEQGGYSYHDIETRVAPWVKDVDVYRVSHHGSSHASNPTLLAQLGPRVAILQVGDGNGNGHPAQSTVDRLLARSALYLTDHGEATTDLGAGRVAGHVVLRTATGVDYTVNGDPFAASDPVRVDGDGDGYFKEADPDDCAAGVVPAPNGGCDLDYEACR
ncbi:MAG: MBL fold metallo-hydrolase [Deltaproteobacteria bacterium]|nr:MBL fold metallo-hydrolase [Deltaproteobacteria bacterium]